MTAPRIAVVGSGPVARALASAYATNGGTVAAAVSRSPERAEAMALLAHAGAAVTDLRELPACDLVLVAVDDRALPELGAQIAAVASLRGKPVLHTSGALAGDAFGGGFAAGSLHPLQSFPRDAADADLAARVVGTHFFHEGAGGREAAAMTTIWRGTLHRLAPGAKTLYHAGAATLSNHAVALFDAATRLFERAGVPRAESRDALAALLAGTTANLAAVGVPAALTGPVARGDAAAIRRHLDALRDEAPELRASYVALARRALVLAREKGGIRPTDADAIARLLQ
jgi:predicted short-subunit dehydrogenase-like oxidoreductase (DUF2520 family)